MRTIHLDVCHINTRGSMTIKRKGGLTSQTPNWKKRFQLSRLFDVMPPAELAAAQPRAADDTCTILFRAQTIVSAQTFTVS